MRLHRTQNEFASVLAASNYEGSRRISLSRRVSGPVLGASTGA